MEIFYEKDAEAGLLKGKKVAIAGYGSQGHAHALNLKDSGVQDICVGLYEGSRSAAKARADGFAVKSVAEAAAWADVMMVLLPDEHQARIYQEEIAKPLPQGAALFFAHGLSIHFKLIEPREDLDVVMIAPKGPGHTVRSEYNRGGGVPALLAVHHDASGHARALGLSYAHALGALRAGVIKTTFREECETDLFGEQAVLCGGITELIRAGFETLVEAGYSPEMAYFECLHEMKLIVDLMYEGGIANMFYSVSNTAEYGAYVSGPRVVDKATKRRMRAILAEIQKGQFTRDWMLENKVGQTSFKTMRDQQAQHPIEKIGKTLRAMMPWIEENRLVNRHRD